MLLSFFRWLFSLFSAYTDSEEKKIGKFFRKFSEKNFSALDRIFLENAMQKNPVRLHLYLEKKYKGYKNLDTGARKKLYENFEKIFSGLEKFCEFGRVKLWKKFQEEKLKWIHGEWNGEQNQEDQEKLFFLFCITEYLELGKILKYKESSAFSKILKDPEKILKKNFLVGDCNQIVTLYICLYAKKFPVSDLHLKIFDHHICLYFQGIDIETTTGKFCKYQDFLFLTSVYENISVNLLDVSDREMIQEKISPYSLLQASKLAFAFSSHRDIVQKNFKRAEKNMALFFLQSKNFSQAIHWAKKIPDNNLSNKAQKYWGYALLSKNNFSASRKKFQSISDKKSLKNCDRSELSFLLKKIKGITSKKKVLQKKSVLQKILKLAQKLDEKKIVKFCEDVLG